MRPTHAPSSAMWSFAAALLAVAALVGAVAPERAAAQTDVAMAEPRAEALDAFLDARLRDAVLIYDQRFRVPETGQYLDAIRLGDAPQEPLSSIASTGAGLVSLALGDALGVIPDAAEKAEITLTHLLGEAGAPAFATDRSENGWFRHWFDARTGAPPAWNRDKFSTIDTAILAAGADVLRRHFERRAQAAQTGPLRDEMLRVAALAERLVASVDWSGAIRDPDRGSIHLVFFGRDERPSERAATIAFDEYALLPCLAAASEEARGVRGAATTVWEQRFDMVDDLPMLDHGALTLVGKPTGAVPSHFTHLFAFYLCPAYAADPYFVAELSELERADRGWFADRGAPAGLWGLGAGSEIVFDADEKVVKQRYGVARLAKNPNLTASPAIMAGFLPVDLAAGERRIAAELKALWDARMCRYEVDGLGFLWRCSAKDPTARVDRVEGVDFSTWLFGLAAAHPDIGLALFRH